MQRSKQSNNNNNNNNNNNFINTNQTCYCGLRNVKYNYVEIIIIIKFLYLSACQQRVAYKRRALKVYITKTRLRLELKQELELD
jgi:hypothetical protein